MLEEEFGRRILRELGAFFVLACFPFYPESRIFKSLPVFD
jgi:hypothetical protein